jgi:outer membrane protein OmpA-like peptidoglycan-associated protein
MKRLQGVILALAVATALAVGVGCATKKYVQETVAPVQKRVEETEKTNAQQAASIAELEKGVSRVDERAKAADDRAGAAAREAARANEQAAVGIKDAAGARAVGEKGVARAGEVDRNVTTLGTKVENLDNFKVISSETVLFDLGGVTLKDDAKQKLDAIVAKVGSMKRFVIEVQGFTDSTGGEETNVRLSQRRADAVVRYLTSQGKVPLYRVQTAGYGEDSPAADNKTRAGRSENRRVEIKLYAADLGM